jgi:RNA polymerase sigma-70 factor (ECF subfamily)
MAITDTHDSDDTARLLGLATEGDQRAWGSLLARDRDRLRRMVALRLDRRLQGRIDASDVIQQAYLEAASRLAEYLRKRPAPFFLWLRFLVGQQLMVEHRRHLGVKARDVCREISLFRGDLPEATSAALAAQLLGHDTRPSVAFARAERKLLLEEALNRMDAVDREVLTLRHFEQLSNAEAAEVLGLQESAASKRYIRALRRIKEILQSLPGGDEELEP